jgi:hypothetical protein
MAAFGVACVTLAVLIAVSLVADRAFSSEPRLPMQWTLTGSVVWSAPRRRALLFTPVLSAVILFAIAGVLSVLGEEDSTNGLLAMCVVSGMLVGVHGFHLWLVRRTLP